MSENVFYINDKGGLSYLSHHGILGQKWGIRRFQPYPIGSGKRGKEVGAAKKVKQERPSATAKAKAKAKTAKEKEKAALKIEKAKARTAREKGKANLKIEKAKARAEKERGKRRSEEIAGPSTVSKIAKKMTQKPNQQKATQPTPKSVKPKKLSKRQMKKLAKEQAKNQPKLDPSSPEYQEAKKRAIESGKAREVSKYKRNMTNAELGEAVKRLNLEKQLKEYSDKEVKSKMQQIDDFVNTASKIGDWAEKGIKVYQSINKLQDTFNSGKKRR